MNTLAKPKPAKTPSPVGAVMPTEEVSAQSLLETLARHKDKKLIFAYDGRDVRPSYHVTEVKTVSFQRSAFAPQSSARNEPVFTSVTW